MNTRQPDLELLEQARDEAKTTEGKAHRQAILEIVYEQSKDAYLEKLRKDLMTVMERLTKNPLPQDFMKYNDIRKKVQTYAAKAPFQRKLVKTLSRLSQQEAMTHINEQEEVSHQ